MIRGYDIIGSIAILKFPKETSVGEKKKFAKKLIEEHNNIRTVLEKTEKVKGRLRTIKTRFLAGKNTKETVHNESGVRMKLNVETCYFSPRLSNERLEVAKLIRSGKVLVLFAGVSPFSLIISRYSKAKKIVSVELGRECCKYARENVKLNKIKNIEIIQKDVNKLKLKEKFDYIIMPRPQLEDSFLKPVFKLAKKGTIIVYYGFADNVEEITDRINSDSKKLKKKIEILNYKRAGDIGPYKYRWRVDFKILN